MKESIIFCFTGTGNSLKLANDIAKNIGNCKVLPMKKGHEEILKEDYEYIGFVFPVYFAGVPKRVYEFIKSLNTCKIKDSYVFSIATKGGFSGNSINIISNLLKEKNINLNYGKSIKMVANNVSIYNITKDIDKKNASYNNEIQIIINDIITRKNSVVKKDKLIFNLWYNFFIKNVNEKDRNFNVSDDCISCEMCRRICPVKNITMNNSKPKFEHHCEQCLSCIHFCPKKAINYKNRTKNRRRYHNKDITFTDIEKFNNL